MSLLTNSIVKINTLRYQKGEIGRTEYLDKMGAVTLKASHAMGKARLVADDVEREDDGHGQPDPDQTLDDSFSETRPLPNPDYESSDSEVEQEDPFLDRLKKVNNRAYMKPILQVTRPSNTYFWTGGCQLN